MLSFKTYAQLYSDIVDFSSVLPDFDLVVGIPRSGMLVANMFALHRNIPLSELSHFSNGKIFKCGTRITFNTPKQMKDVLVLEDSTSTGNSITEARAILSKLTGYNIKYGVLYHVGKFNLFDYGYELVPHPRMWEWGLFHSWVLDSTCMDVDGVLCLNPAIEQNDDGPRYIDFVTNVMPKYRPTYPIKTIITSRLEKYRGLTADWLAKHNIIYKNLVMSPHNTMAERKHADDYAIRKAEEYIKPEYQLFIESSEIQSKQINNITKKPVYCTDTCSFFPQLLT